MSRAMKWIFVLLLLANAAFFAFTQFVPGKSAGESASLHQPFRAEKIRIISETELQSMPQQAPASIPQVCLEWGAFGAEELERVKEALKPLQLAESYVSVRTSGDKAASKFWVLIPPQKTKQEAQKKVSELKSMGVEDSIIIQDNGKWHFAVSLGVFSSEEGAKKYLAQLQSKGVRSAVVMPRGQGDNLSTLVIKATREGLEADLVKVKQDFPASELKAVECVL